VRRSGELRRTGDLKRSGPPKRRSTRRVDETDAYRALSDAKLAAHPHCQLGPLIALVDPAWRGCTGWSTELHHLRKLSSGGARVSDENTLASCNGCNAGWVENEGTHRPDPHGPSLAEAAGLAIREGHPMWDALSARTVRLDETARTSWCTSPLEPAPAPVGEPCGPDPF
jgi:hypothetical protein